jgi:hypothetical protein
MNRDISIMQEFYPMIKSTLQETMDQFTGSQMDKTKAILMLLLKLYSLRDRTFKGVIYGFGSNDIRGTYQTLMDRNLTNGSVAYSQTELIMPHINSHAYDKIYAAYNHQIISLHTGIKDNKLFWNEVGIKELEMFIQDRNLSHNVRKRILMGALASGFVENVVEWTQKLGIILHKWQHKQRFDPLTKKYSGNYKITFFQGHKQLQISYNSVNKRYTVRKANVDDPEILYNLLQDFLDLLDLTSEDFIKGCIRGPWIIDKDKVLKSNSGDFMIDNLSVEEPIVFFGCKLSVNDDRTSLFDEFGYSLLNIETGLLESTVVIPDSYNIKCYGLKFNDCVKLRAMTNHFNITYISREQSMAFLNDLIVDRPTLDEETIKKLGLSNWTKIGKTEDGETKIEVSEVSVIDDLLNFDINEAQNFISTMDQETEIIDYLLDSNLLHSMRTIQKIQQSRRLFNNVRSLKYDLICSCMLIDMKINLSTIQAINKILTGPNKKYVMHSLFYLYDKVQNMNGYKSPTDAIFQIYSPFATEFELEEYHSLDEY